MMKISRNNSLKMTSWFIGSWFFFSLAGCESCTVGSKESLEAKERRPWRPDESSVAGVEEHSSKRMTPHIGFNMPLEEPSKIILKTKELPNKESIPHVKTSLNKKKRSIEVITDKKSQSNP